MLCISSIINAYKNDELDDLINSARVIEKSNLNHYMILKILIKCLNINIRCIFI